SMSTEEKQNNRIYKNTEVIEKNKNDIYHLINESVEQREEINDIRESTDNLHQSVMQNSIELYDRINALSEEYEEKYVKINTDIREIDGSIEESVEEVIKLEDTVKIIENTTTELDLVVKDLTSEVKNIISINKEIHKD